MRLAAKWMLDKGYRSEMITINVMWKLSRYCFFCLLFCFYCMYFLSYVFSLICEAVLCLELVFAEQGQAHYK